MKFLTNQNNLENIYSSSTKIIIASEDCELYLNLLQSESLESQIKVYQFNSDRNSLDPVPDLNLELNSQLHLVPNFCLALISFSDLGTSKLNRLLSWWSDHNSTQLPMVVRLDSQLEPAILQQKFWQQMYGLMAVQTQTLAQRITSMQKQYLDLRSLHENMQNAFATVEDYLSQAKLPPLQLAFETEITDRSIKATEIANGDTATLRQLLPVSARGLAAIELYIAQQCDQGEGNLKISLQACEDTTNIAVWQIPYSQLSVGWRCLDLPSIDLGRKRDVELIIEWHQASDLAPALSLTKIQLIPEARAYSDRLVLDRSLAMRIWQGLPGTRKVTSPHSLITENQDRLPTPQLGYLGQGAMATVEAITPNLPTDNFAYIQALDNGAKIMTHPRANGTATIAMLPFCFPPTANQLTATVATEHPEGGIVEYAIAIISLETDPKICLNSHSALAFSDWIAVAADTPKKITLNLDCEATEHCHIVLATKLAEGSTEHCAWATWLNFHCAVAQTKILATRPNYPMILGRQNAQLKDATLELFESTIEKVQAIENGQKIQVSPRTEGDTVAILINAIDPGIIQVKSTVCTEHESASAIEYAIAVITTDDEAIARLALHSLEFASGCSGWQRVEPNIPHTLTIDLDVPTTDICHLVLATRLPENGSPNNALARWLDLECVVSQPSPLVSQG